MLTDKQKKLIEKSGVLLEKTGLAPAQARIASLLIISDEVELTFDEIKDSLKLSKSATSNAINSLLAMEKIGYTVKIGDRKRYFKSKIASMEIDFEDKIDKMLTIKYLLQEIVDQRTKKTPDFNEKLNSMIQFMTFMQSELPILFEKWNQLKAKKS